MAESITESTLAHFHKQIGDRIEVDEELASIETDKIDVSVNAPEAGVLAELLVAPGDTVTIGQDIARIDTTAESTATASKSWSVAAAKPSPAHSDSTADTEKMQSSTEQSSSEGDANLGSQEQWRNNILPDVIVSFPTSNASTLASRVLEQPRPIESPNPQPRDSQAATEIFPFRDERVVYRKLPKPAKYLNTENANDVPIGSLASNAKNDCSTAEIVAVDKCDAHHDARSRHERVDVVA